MAALVIAAPATGTAARGGYLAAYLRARAADANQQGEAAVRNYARALDGSAASPLVAIRAYREGIAAGDRALVRRAADVLSAADVAPLDAGLFPLADAARVGDVPAVAAALKSLNQDRLRLVVPALTGWVAFARGDDGPAAIEAAGGDVAARRIAAESRALLLLATNRFDDGMAATRALSSGAVSGFRIAAAELLFGAGRGGDAKRLLRDDPDALAAARAGAIERPTIAYGVSRLLLRVADDLVAEKSSSIGLALARAALDADSDYARAHLVIADQLVRAGDLVRAAAELDAVPDDSPLATTVAAQRIDLLNRQDRIAEALDTARSLAEDDDARPVDKARYADLLFADNRPEEALPWYRRVLKERGPRDNWLAWLRYGGALDEAGRWKEAERALRRAAKLGPQQPSVLNYLGYTLVDRGEDVAEGTRMLERAHALDADDPAITDSLGWAYHIGGQTERALPLIERAAAAAPTDPEIADHLGDLYWSLGRRYEARYQWRAAALTAEPPLAARIADKLASGLAAR